MKPASRSSVARKATKAEKAAVRVEAVKSPPRRRLVRQKKIMPIIEISEEYLTSEEEKTEEKEEDEGEGDDGVGEGMGAGARKAPPAPLPEPPRTPANRTKVGCIPSFKCFSNTFQMPIRPGVGRRVVVASAPPPNMCIRCARVFHTDPEARQCNVVFFHGDMHQRCSRCARLSNKCVSV